MAEGYTPYNPRDPNSVYSVQDLPVFFQEGNPENWASTEDKLPGGKGVRGKIRQVTYGDGRIAYQVLDDSGQVRFDLSRQDRNDTVTATHVQATTKTENTSAPITAEQRSAEASKAQTEASAAAAEAAERSANAEKGLGYITNAQVAQQSNQQAEIGARLADVNARIQQIQQNAIQQAETNRLEREKMQQSGEQFGVTTGLKERELGQQDTRIAQGAEEIQLRREGLGLQQQQLDFQQGPQFQLELTKQAFAEKQGQLSNLLAARRIDQETAIHEMNNWYRMNVEVPYKRDEAARMRAAEERQLQQLEDQSAQFAASHSLNRARLGVEAGSIAQQGEIATFPYRIGPTGAASLASATNALAKGTTEGINFQPTDFTFSTNLDKIREKASANALKNVSKYARNIVMQNGGRTSTELPNIDWSAMPSMPGVGGGAAQQFLQQYYPSFIPPEAQQQEQPAE